MNGAAICLAWIALDPSPDTRAGGGPHPGPAPSLGLAQRPPPGDSGAQRPVPTPDPAALQRAAKDGPPVDVLRVAASALVLADPGRARSLVLRARWAPWLPEVRFRVDRRFGRSESLDVSPVPLGDAPPVALDTVDEVRYEARATWDLSRLVFNPDELAAHAEALKIAEVRREVETLVIRLYFERRRLKVEAAAADGYDVASNLRRDARIEELEAELDALTGGVFSRSTAARGGASTPALLAAPASP
ncbi:MAG TPA: hypothetical protein VFH68_23260 [Polyangia bacterium]|jgi:hypothetical protein|nr:hypothetical protein [Polyangia bacterium]